MRKWNTSKIIGSKRNELNWAGIAAMTETMWKEFSWQKIARNLLFSLFSRLPYVPTLHSKCIFSRRSLATAGKIAVFTYSFIRHSLVLVRHTEIFSWRMLAYKTQSLVITSNSASGYGIWSWTHFIKRNVLTQDFSWVFF